VYNVLEHVVTCRNALTNYLHGVYANGKKATPNISKKILNIEIVSLDA